MTYTTSNGVYLSVIIPVYNEAKRIEKTLRSVNEYLSKQTYNYEVLIINDGSTDETSKIVSDFVLRASNFKLLDNSSNRGKGWIVKQGMLAAQGDIGLFMDADNSTTIDQFETFVPYFKEGYDMVIGSRRITGSVIAVRQPLYRDFLGGVFRLIVKIIVPLGVTDSQAGFKAFSQRAVQTIFPQQTIWRWAFDVELLALARRAGLRIKEAPIRWVNDSESKVKLKGMVAMLSEVLTVRWRLWSNRYKL